MEISFKKLTIANVLLEGDGARGKFPSNKHMLAALTEEVGELAQALIDCDRGKQPPQNVYNEAIQVANMALRIAEEGSEEFNYKFDKDFGMEFRAVKKP